MTAVYRAIIHFVRHAVPLAAMGLALTVGTAHGAETPRAYPSLFGSSERMFSDTSLFPKWSEMLKHLVQHEALEDHPPVPCGRQRGLNFCEIKKWESFTESLRGGDRVRVLDFVNRLMNAYPYVLDIVNYGIDDYWATPQEHISNGGDCEDYAIAKYVTLRRLGFRPADMRVVVLNDLNLKVQHAVLAVYIGDRAYILDNQTARVTPSDRIFHYQPIYSVTEGHWWMHLAKVNSAH